MLKRRLSVDQVLLRFGGFEVWHTLQHAVVLRLFGFTVLRGLRVRGVRVRGLCVLSGGC